MLTPPRTSADQTTPTAPLDRDPSSRRQQELDRMAGCSVAKSVTVPLAHVTKLLIDAAQSNRTWLRDFADDVVRIDADLYDVLMAYQTMRETSAR